jgi:Amt family ammonium transporter
MGGAGPFATLGGGAAMNSEFTITLFGKEFGLFGTKGFFLSGEAYDAAAFSMFLFQMVFMDTTATIPTGSMAERWSFKSFTVYALLVGAVIYPLYANWVWGGGWLAKLGSNFNLGHGHVDFAGSSVVHMTGGVLAIVGAKMLGPRLGKFSKDGTPNAMPGHHIPMAIVGCFILAFGWFGFNAGSSLAGTDLRIGVVAVNTMLASAGGAFASTLYMWFVYGKPDISMAANGFLAGLVAITAPCAFVTAPAAVLIGLIAGCCSAGPFSCGADSENRRPGGRGLRPRGQRGLGRPRPGALRRRDLRRCAERRGGRVTGLFYGDASQLAAQCIGILANIVYVGLIGYVVFKLLDVTIGLRVDPEHEARALTSTRSRHRLPDFNIRSSPR